MIDNVRPMPVRRPYKIPASLRNKASSFVNVANPNNEPYLLEDLAKSALEPLDIAATADPFLKLWEGALAGYCIPYFFPNGEYMMDPEGQLIMWRVRQKYPPLISDAQRYFQPKKEDLAKYGLPSVVPYLNPGCLGYEGNVVAICEGEKKTAAFAKWAKIPAIGIGGKDSWAIDKKQTIHPWILDVLRAKNPDQVIIIPDADIWNYQVCKSYGDLANGLKREGFKIEIVNPPGKIDDLIFKWRDTSRIMFDLLPKIDPADLVQSRKTLAREYNLAVEAGKSDDVVQQHSGNVIKLLENHKAFDKIWRNLDSGAVMIGKEEAQGDVTEMMIANHFQHNFQFNKVNSNLVLQCIRALAGKNSKSPMLDKINELVWDGVSRIETWLVHLWGVKDSEFTREVSKKFLVGSIARMTKPGCKMDWMLVIVGPQGIGKTSMPKVLFDNNDVILSTDSGDKDFQMILHSGLCIIVDEVDKFSKADTSTWKSRLTDTVDYFRPPYGATVGKHPRRSVFYGTTNVESFLMPDSSGYRRYAPVKATRMLDFEKLELMKDQLWAEAKYLYDHADVDFCNIKAEPDDDYTIPNLYEEGVQSFINQYCTNKKENKNYSEVHGGYVYRMKDVLEVMGLDRQVGNPGLTREVAKVMTAMGVKKVRTRHWRPDNAEKAWLFPEENPNTPSQNRDK